MNEAPDLMMPWTQLISLLKHLTESWCSLSFTRGLKIGGFYRHTWAINSTLFFSFFWISIESMQQTGKQFFTLAAYKLHALCVNKNFPVQPLRLSRTYERFHPENILTIPRQLMVWRAYVLPEYWRLFTFYHKRALNRQTEGSGLAQSAACLSGRQSHFNKLQYAYDSHKMINFKKCIPTPYFLKVS